LRLHEPLRPLQRPSIFASTHQLGVKLDFDPAKVQFLDSDQANQPFTRDYREPSNVPQVA